MNEEVKSVVLKLAEKKYPQAVVRRRDFHKHPESGWTEFRTASIVAEVLEKLGYEVLVGAEVCEESAMMGVPHSDELEKMADRAIQEGASPHWVEKMAGGKTGVVGILKGKGPGPVVGLRFDMDANDLVESQSENHRPVREGFRSIHENVAHGCGHDGHTAIGLGVAEVLTELKDQLKGTVKLIFQPAEEGVRGARSMVAAGVADDIDFFLSGHLGFILKSEGAFSSNSRGFLATTKLDAIFKGAPAHAGGNPQDGKNALLAAATASIHLHSISRHSDGVTRINVGQLQAGSGRNVIPAEGRLKLETRGGTTALNEYMERRAREVIQGAAEMYECDVEILSMGSSACAESHPELAERMLKVAKESGLFQEFIEVAELGGSEDCAYFMEKVSSQGGQAIYMMIGAEIAAGHHEAEFDFSEGSLRRGIGIFSLGVLSLLGEE